MTLSAIDDRWKRLYRTLTGLKLMRIEDDIETGLTNFKSRVSQGGEDILTGLRSLGRNDDTESFLKIFKPDVSDDDVTSILGEKVIPQEKPPDEENRNWWNHTFY